MNVAIVETPADLAAVCARIARAERVGLDTEFHTEKSYTPHLMVVQLLFDDGVAIVDPLALRDLRPLVEALSGARVVGHALSSDLRILADAFGMLPRAVFDTQIAAAFAHGGERVFAAPVNASLPNVRAFATSQGTKYNVLLFNLDQNNAVNVPVGVSALASGSGATVTTYGKAQYDQSKNNVWTGSVTSALGSWRSSVTVALPPWSVTLVSIKP